MCHYPESDKKIFLIDFGAIQIIKKLYDLDLTIFPHPVMFTPGYAPQQQRNNGEVYNNSDFYSLGIVAIEALAGEHPNNFTRDSNHQIIWPHTVNIRAELASILDKMVQPLPIDRYQSTQEIIDELSKV